MYVNFVSGPDIEIDESDLKIWATIVIALLVTGVLLIIILICCCTVCCCTCLNATLLKLKEKRRRSGNSSPDATLQAVAFDNRVEELAAANSSIVDLTPACSFAHPPTYDAVNKQPLTDISFPPTYEDAVKTAVHPE